MALVYRLIPVPDSVFEARAEDYTIVIYKSTRKKIKTLEKEFYELGYIESSEATPFFTISDYGDEGKLIRNSFGPHPGIETKAFFLFPQDALRALLYCNKNASQSNAAVWLCEYDIPDDILKEYLGFGYYNRRVLPEFQIPLEKLAELDAVVPSTDAEPLKEALKIQHQKNLETYITTPVPNKKLNAIRQQMPQFFARPNYLEETFAYGLSNKRTYFPSQIITHRSFLTGKWEILSEKCEGCFEKIAPKSNGILTQESQEIWESYCDFVWDSKGSELLSAKYIRENILTNNHEMKLEKK